jgi:hypothetical protein
LVFVEMSAEAPSPSSPSWDFLFCAVGSIFIFDRAWVTSKKGECFLSKKDRITKVGERVLVGTERDKVDKGDGPHEEAKEGGDFGEGVCMLGKVKEPREVVGNDQDYIFNICMCTAGE